MSESVADPPHCTDSVHAAPPASKIVPAALREVAPPDGAPITDAALVQSLAEMRLRLRQVQRERDEALAKLDALQRGAQDPGGLGPSTPSDISPSVPPPTTWDELFERVHKEYPDQVVFTSRARRAARKSAYEDIAEAWTAISILAEPYRDVRMGGSEDDRKRLEDALAKAGFRIGPTGQAVRNHSTRDLYQFTWEGRTYRMETHLQGSSHRDERRCLRIYFTWVPEQCVLLIGSLPQHLRNTLT